MTSQFERVGWRAGRWALMIVLLCCALTAPVWADDPTPTPGSVFANLNSDEPEVRAEAVIALMAFGDASAADRVFALLADPDPRVGLYAAQALGALASPENLPALREGLRHASPEVRWRTALVLGEMEDVRAVPALARALDDPEVLVHRTAADSLVKIGGAAGSERAGTRSGQWDAFRRQRRKERPGANG